MDVFITKTGIFHHANKDKIACTTWIFHTFSGSTKSETSVISTSASNTMGCIRGCIFETLQLNTRRTIQTDQTDGILTYFKAASQFE
jgi:hypothetical protein